ncbi:MAG: IclR family transcriptional regulator [Anaerolineales bacterium]
MPEIKKSESKKYKVQSVERALQILSCFSLTAPELTLIEICEKTELPKPTVFRLLSAMENLNFITRTADQQRYTVGIRVFELGNVYLSNLSLEQVISPYMQEITQKFNIACNLAILDSGQVVYIASTNTSGPFQYAPIIGYRHYVHCSALGKSLLIDKPQEEILSILSEKGMPSLSPHTITEPEEYLAEIETARELGYTEDDQEGAVGIYCLSVPIKNSSGKVIAALSVSGPSPKYTDDFKEAIIQDLKMSAKAALKRL